ncbi:MAG: cytochrome c5 family protein [Rhodocyclaceae bacterium]|nr:cytochrome c5 family protein [Dechloromonas sp.]MBP9654163.1 cytochrome c5 family protein [Rhodocyclaceae bacterium]
MAEQHSSKGIMITTIVVAIILTAIVVPFSLKGERSAADSGSADQADSRIQPVARFELAKAAPAAAAGPKDGATIVNTVCGACHGTGVAGAPKTGDKAAWAPRIAQGNDTLYKNAISGKNAMPPKGGAADLSDAEIKGAVDHLVGLSK